MQRAAIFIDGSNMLYTQKYLGWTIDWVKLRNYIGGQYQLVSAKYYLTFKIPPSDEQKSFHTFLATNGFALKTKILKEIIDRESGERHYKGNLDIELAIDALTSSNQYDIFILFSGDGDFVPLIQALKASGKMAIAYSTKGCSSIELVSELGMDFHDLNEVQSMIEYHGNGSKANRKGKSQGETIARIGSRLPDIGDRLTTKVQNIKEYGVFLENEWDAKVLLHVSNLGINEYIPDVSPYFNKNDVFEVEVIDIDSTPIDRKISVRLVDESMIKTLRERLLME